MRWFFAAACLLFLSACVSPGHTESRSQLPAGADEVPRVTVQEVQSLQEKGNSILFLDTRTGPAWSGSDVKIPGALRIDDPESLATVMDRISKEDLVVTYCT